MELPAASSALHEGPVLSLGHPAPQRGAPPLNEKHRSTRSRYSLRSTPLLTGQQSLSEGSVQFPEHPLLGRKHSLLLKATRSQGTSGTSRKLLGARPRK